MDIIVAFVRRRRPMLAGAKADDRQQFLGRLVSIATVPAPAAMSIVAFPTAEANRPDPGDGIFCQSGAAEGGALGFLHRQGYDVARHVRPLVGDLRVMQHRHPLVVAAARMGLRVEFVAGFIDLGGTGMADAMRALVLHGALRVAGRSVEFEAEGGA